MGIYRCEGVANDGDQDVILNEVKNLLEADNRRSQKGWSRRRSFVTLRMTVDNGRLPRRWAPRNDGEAKALAMTETTKCHAKAHGTDERT